MAIMGKTLLALILLTSIFSIAASSKKRRSSHNSIDWWCNQTPYPDACKYMKQSNHYPHRIKHKSQFRNNLIHLALERAVLLRKQAREFEQTSITKKQRSVSRDCLRLYDNTVWHLNRTFQYLHDRHKKKNCSPFDAQTWLSTSRTNMRTCQNGAMELRIPNFIVPMIKNNVTKIISNGLYVNWGFVKQETEHYTGDAEYNTGKTEHDTEKTEQLRENYTGETEHSTEKPEHHTGETGEGEFPRWVSKHERKLLTAPKVKAHLVVAKDGSGHFKTVQGALDIAARRRFKTRFIIHVKRGVYRENIEVDKANDNIMLVGDGMKYTVITSRRSVKDGFTTYSSATAGIDGPHFIARDITFENTAGPRKGQAVALRSASDLSVFHRCSIKGYQDTLMAHAQRQFYKECYIFGTIDFIFGNAAVVFQNCVILVRRPLSGQGNMITAQGRDDPFQNTGISIHNCQIKPALDLKPVVSRFRTFLGRPWQRYSRVVVMKTFMDSFVSPTGWSPWDNTNFAQSTLYYGEYRNSGPGSSTRNRVRWPGYHVIKSPTEASRFTVASLLAGNSWLPTTGVPFRSGL